MSDDRYDDIKRIVGATNPGFFVSLPPDSARYLIAEVERLRVALADAEAENERLRQFGEFTDRYDAAELVAVRAALQGLYDATAGFFVTDDEFEAARVVAADVLAACICVRGSDGPDESCPIHGRRAAGVLNREVPE